MNFERGGNMIIRLCAFADEAGASASEQIEALRGNGISLVEVRKMDGKPITAYSIAKAENYRKKFNDAGIKVYSLGSSIGKVRENIDMSEYEKVMLGACDTAKALGALNIRAFSFYPGFIRHNKDIVTEKLKRLVDIASENGLCYCHENEKGIYGSTAQRVSELLDAIPEMKLIYDPANFLQCSQEPAETLELFAGRAEYFHIKDARGKRVVPAGFGDGRLAQLVSGINRDTVFSVEPHLFMFRGSEEYNKSSLYGRHDLKTKRGKFDCAVASCRKLLEENGWENRGAYYEKGDKNE